MPDDLRPAAVERDVVIVALWDVPLADFQGASESLRRSAERTAGPAADRVLAALAAARDGEAVDPRAVAHIECDCVPSLGPSHCHLCSGRAGREVPWSEAHSAAPTVTAEQVGEAWRSATFGILDASAAVHFLAALGIEVREP